MLRRLASILAVVALGTVFALGSAQAGHGDRRPQKNAVLLVAFGTSVPEARKALDRIETRVREAFPGVEARWAYTSSIVRAKLAGEGVAIDSPEVALAKLMNEDYTHVAVMSLHTIPGEEFHDLYVNAHLFKQMAGGFDRLLVARPLLSSHEDMVRVARAMLEHVPEDRRPDDTVLLMGHGSEHHPADAVYGAMNQVFQELDSNVHVATVEGYPTLKSLLPLLKQKRSKKVYLLPFMSVAGDHAVNDMAGDEPDSWKSVLTQEGFECVAVLKGTAEYPGVVDVWLDHLRGAFGHF